MPDNYIRDHVDDVLVQIHNAIANQEFIINDNERQAVELCLKRVLSIIK